MIKEPKQNIEYFYKRSTYLFPEGTKIYLNGNKLLVEIEDKKTRDIKKYLVNRADLTRDYNNRIGLPITGAGSDLADEYQMIAEYIDKHPQFNYLDFEYATSYELVLCTFFKPMDFNIMKNLIHEIHKYLPFIINIFRKPYIHLKEKEILQPVEAAMRINYKTINYLSKHSERWKSIDDRTGSIEPDKLLTKIYVDDYSIYENVVFYNLINKIFTFLMRTIYYLSDILETFNDSIQLDAVNRFNHQMYYLAIGKLYVGFYNMENTAEIAAVLEDAKNLYKQLIRYKTRDVYTHNINTKPLNGDIKKTNLFAMHKDYKHVYTLYKKFKKKTFIVNDYGSYLKQTTSQRFYQMFCEMLTLFAISNFNFKNYNSEDIYKDGEVRGNFNFKNWELRISSQYNYAIGLDTIAIKISYLDNAINYLIIPMSYYIAQERKKQYEIIIHRLNSIGEVYDKYFFFEPFDYEDNSLNSYSIRYEKDDIATFYAILPIAISEINSFRRIQKILLEGMVISNNKFDICPFCGEALTNQENHYLCNKCRTVIKPITCNNCNNAFVASYSDIKTRKKNRRSEAIEGLMDFYKQERQYYFRNTVFISKAGIHCPYCEHIDPYN